MRTHAIELLVVFSAIALVACAGGAREPQDAATTRVDAAIPIADAGPIVDDAGSPMDAGSPVDAGPNDGGDAGANPGPRADAAGNLCDGIYDGIEPVPPCSCQALDLGFCVLYETQEPALLDVGECAALGGVEVVADCPESNRRGICGEIDDCHDPAYIFYANYAGAIEGYADIPAIQAACNAGVFVEQSCAEWRPQ